MALYALGDLHLSFQAKKPMNEFGTVWKHHEEKIEKYVHQIVQPEDTLVLTVPGAEGCRNAGKIWILSNGCRDRKFSFGAITICFGRPTEPSG